MKKAWIMKKTNRIRLKRKWRKKTSILIAIVSIPMKAMKMKKTKCNFFYIGSLIKIKKNLSF